MPTPSWWRVLTGIDPISLEPLAALPYPPIELRADPNSTSASDFFDPRVLGLYLASSGHFSHPISRRDVTRDECVALDAHLRRCGVSHGVSEVAKVFDRQNLTAAPQEDQAELAELRRHMQDALAEALYRGSEGGRNSRVSSARSRSRAQPADRNPTRNERAASRLSASARQDAHAAAYMREGGMTMVDDDLVPTHARGTHAPGGGVVSAADYGEWPSAAHSTRRSTRGPAAATAAAESFPALPSPAPRTLSTVTLPPEVTAAAAGRAAAREAAAAAAAAAAERVAETAAAMREAMRSEKGRVLRAALAMVGAAAAESAADDAADGSAEDKVASALEGAVEGAADDTAESEADGTGNGEVAAAEVPMGSNVAEQVVAAATIASAAFTSEALELARSQSALVAEVERHFDLLIAGGERRRPLRAMPRQHRRLVHELSHLYHIGTVASGVEPQRSVCLLRTDASGWPDCALSEAAQLVQAAARMRSGATPADGAAAASGSGSAAAAAARVAARGWPIRLVQVECDERAVSSMLSVHRGEYAVVWAPERRTERRAAREALQLTATLTFASESSARAVLQTVGGGCRGRFRVQRPEWVARGSGGGGGDVDAATNTDGAGVRVVVALGLAQAGVRVLLVVEATVGEAPQAGDGPLLGAAAARPQPPRPSEGRARRIRRTTAWQDAEVSWTAAHEELATMLTGMGFGERAARRASLRVGVADEASRDRHSEALIVEAISWLTSEAGMAAEAEAEAEAEADAEVEAAVEAEAEAAVEEAVAAAVQTQKTPRDARTTEGVRGGRSAKPKSNVKPSANRWAALLEDE